MACAVCQHCNATVQPAEGAVHGGLSYHKQCLKCFVCGETDLRNAETFLGVIFCAGCSRCIFQGCSAARQDSSARGRRRARGPRQRRRRRHGGDRVLTMTINGETDSQTSVESDRNSNVGAAYSPVPETISDLNNQKKSNAERSTITKVTHVILKRAADQEMARNIKSAPAQPRKTLKTHKKNQAKKECSDLRIAELGASVEIAHMALRKRSEMPVIIKSESLLKHRRSRTMSILNQASDISGDSNYSWPESQYGLEDESEPIHWTRRIGSILKIPLKSFKRNILDRSSLVKVESSEGHAGCVVKKFRTLFKEDGIEHQRQGLKKLYSTINRTNEPCKLGWLHRKHTEKSKNERCKHFKTSHSYRCMREHVMRLAGPTRSELAVIRGKILNVASPKIIKKIINYNKNYAAILALQAYRRE